jgi:hypothetical protein
VFSNDLQLADSWNPVAMPIVSCGGYAIAESHTAVMSEQVLLRPWAGAPPS